MRKILTIFSAIIITLSSCKKIDKLTNFYMDNTNTIAISSSDFASLNADIWSYEVENSITELCSNNNTNEESIKSISLDRFTVYISSPDPKTFDFIQSLEIFVNASGLEEKKIAWVQNNSKTGVKKLVLDISDDDIQDYIIDNNLILHSLITGSDSIFSNVIIQYDYSYVITANLSGI
ncbi:MAG: hypothetical protein HQ521_00085 [Bacteroidetes bacterium]|nr:hypothetical protein [Bacteroidota bacterium]